MSRWPGRLAVLVSTIAFAPLSSQAQSCLVPSSQIVNGGPGKDGIPALTLPRTATVQEASRFLPEDALVLGVVLNGEARAYPHNVLWWHEIVNDVVGGRPIAVSYCPLTGSGMVYDAVVDGTAVSFGVSGLLFDNNLLLYDRSTDSLWSQLRVQSVCGRLAGRAPALLPVVQSTWNAWKALHPTTTVVSFDTGHSRNYLQYPYGSYDQVGNTQLLFPQSFSDTRRPMKELVLGLRNESTARAYPYPALGARGAVNDDLAGRPVLVVFDAAAEMALPFDRRLGQAVLAFDVAEGPGFPFRLRDRETQSLWDLTGLAVEGPLASQRLQQIPAFSAMWFGWAAFNRGTEVYTPAQR